MHSSGVAAHANAFPPELTNNQSDADMIANSVVGHGTGKLPMMDRCCKNKACSLKTSPASRPSVSAEWSFWFDSIVSCTDVSVNTSSTSSDTANTTTAPASEAHLVHLNGLVNA
jgi:hypothetical protein